MSTSRFHANRIRAAAATLLVAGVALAGCGGGDDGGSEGGGGGGGGAAETQGESEPEGGGGEQGGGGGDGEARQLFISSCGGCHQLSDAGTSGAVGPDLDDTDLDAEGIAQKIDEGGGGMPPDLLQGEQRDAVAEYVASASGA